MAVPPYMIFLLIVGPICFCYIIVTCYYKLERRKRISKSQEQRRLKQEQMKDAKELVCFRGVDVIKVDSAGDKDGEGQYKAVERLDTEGAADINKIRIPLATIMETDVPLTERGLMHRNGQEEG